MLKSYLPAKFNTLAFIILFFLWVFSFYKTLAIAFFAFVLLYISLRRKRNDFRDDPIITKGVIFSPPMGRSFILNTTFRMECMEIN